jgi:hypothetical protein
MNFLYAGAYFLGIGLSVDILLHMVFYGRS